MITFILSVPYDEIILDEAPTPGELDFSRVSGQSCYEVYARFANFPYDGVLIRPVAAVDLTGYEDQADWVAEQLCEEIDFRRAFPGFEDEVKSADGPLVAFGEPNIGPSGFIE